MAGEPTASSQEENNMADIVLKDVSKAYGAVQVLDNLFNLVGVLRTCFKLEYPHPLPHAGEGTK